MAANRMWMSGAFVVLAALLVYHLIIDPQLLAPRVETVTQALVGYAVMWTLAAAVVAMTLLGEGRTLATIGLRRLPLRQMLLGIGIGVCLSLLVPLLTLAAAAMTGNGETAIVDMATGVSIGVVIIGVVTAAVTEEVLFRGYAIERLEEVTGRTWLAGLVSLAVFTVIHLPNWGTVHTFGVVLPLGAALTVLYVWKRNLPLVVLVHFVVDAPLIVLALID